MMTDATMDWPDLFPDTPYAFHLKLRKCPVEEFFRPRHPAGTTLAERRRWLSQAPDHHLALTPPAEGALEEMIAILRSGGLAGMDSLSLAATTSLERCRALGETLDADFLLLRWVDDALKLTGGCVCFPSSWSFGEKVGKSVEEIHDVVPGLNAEMGRAVRTFLQKMAPGVAWMRANWGLSRTGELNQDPWRQLPRLNAQTLPEEIFLRVEHQALVRLPACDGVLFGIRIETARLASLIDQPVVRHGLIRALETMPGPMADYKGISPVRERLLGWLKNLG